jgi:hypothetical protein
MANMQLDMQFDMQLKYCGPPLRGRCCVVESPVIPSGWDLGDSHVDADHPPAL